MDNERFRVWTVGEEATFGALRQADSSILSSSAPHPVYEERRGTVVPVSPRHVDSRLGTRVDILQKARPHTLYRCGPIDAR